MAETKIMFFPDLHDIDSDISPDVTYYLNIFVARDTSKNFG